MQAVEAERTVHKVGRAFARTADAAELDHPLWHNAHLIHRSNDLVRDRVMAAALAECARVSAVITFCKTGKVHVCGCASHGEWLSHNGLLLSLYYFCAPDVLFEEAIAVSDRKSVV